MPRLPLVPGLDKLAHLAMYAALGFLAARARARTGRPRVAAVMGAMAAFAALDEWHQGFIPGRQGELADWVADVTGGTLGMWVFRARGARSMGLES